MAELPGQVVPAPCETSPCRKRRSPDDTVPDFIDEAEAEEDAERALDRMLKERAEPVEEIVPVWAKAIQESCNNLQSTMVSSFRMFNESMSGFHNRLAVVEGQLAQAPADPRVDALTRRVDDLTQLVKTSQATKSSPADAPHAPAADPWAQYKARSPETAPSRGQDMVPSSMSTQETDYCHVVIGGWPFDSARRTIQSDLDRLLATFAPPDRLMIVKTAIYGIRAQVAHVYLEPIAPGLQAERFYKLKETYNKKRAKNRATKLAAEAIASLWMAEQAQEPEIGWQKQIIW